MCHQSCKDYEREIAALQVQLKEANASRTSGKVGVVCYHDASLAHVSKPVGYEVTSACARVSRPGLKGR